MTYSSERFYDNVRILFCYAQKRCARGDTAPLDAIKLNMLLPNHKFPTLIGNIYFLYQKYFLHNLASFMLIRQKIEKIQIFFKSGGVHDLLQICNIAKNRYRIMQ